MQTFLPYPDLEKSARCLDNKRLGKQRVECKQILLALRGESKGWQNHPAVKQWRGNELFLCAYARHCCAEWIARGFKDSLFAFFNEGIEPFLYFPIWFGNQEYHASHRAALLAKKPDWYGRFGWAEAPAIPDEKGRFPYVWPGDYF